MDPDNDEWFNFKDMNKIFRMMQEEFERMLKDSDKGDEEDISSIIRGFSVHVGPDGKPQFKPINNLPPEILRKFAESNFSPAQTFELGGWETPYTEVHENKDEQTYQIVAEVPGIEHVIVEINGRDIMFQGELGDRKYRKQMLLKEDLISETLQWNIRNGVLEIIVGYQVS
ncbi:MAG: Hsp20/alpha crystallin family protein [Candidatus Kariarchaeaceae archaeon]|jgi:HSP20 family protein